MVNVVVENMHFVSQPNSDAMIQLDFAILDRPVCSLRQRCSSRHSNSAGRAANRRSKFFNSKLADRDVVAISAERIGDKARLNHMPCWVIVEIDDVVLIIEP